MVPNLMVGVVTMTLCVSIQCVFVGVLLRLLEPLEKWLGGRVTIVRAWGVLSAVLVMMFAGSLLQMAVWAGVFSLFGEFDDYPTALYHSMVNFTTLGYGDLVMSAQRRVLGAVEAANGVLMFGLTTSILFAVVQALLRRSGPRQEGSNRSGRSPM